MTIRYTESYIRSERIHVSVNRYNMTGGLGTRMIVESYFHGDKYKNYHSYGLPATGRFVGEKYCLIEDVYDAYRLSNPWMKNYPSPNFISFNFVYSPFIPMQVVKPALISQSLITQVQPMKMPTTGSPLFFLSYSYDNKTPSK